MRKVPEKNYFSDLIRRCPFKATQYLQTLCTKCCKEIQGNSSIQWLSTYWSSKKIPNRGVRHLKRLVKDDGRLSATKITSDLNTSLPKPVSTRTVRRYLRDLGYEYVVKIKRQWLSNKHQQQRVDWCIQYMHWTPDDWRKIIFSDESTFHVFKRKNQCKIWRLEREISS